MAERFGGKYSPRAKAADGAPVPAPARGNPYADLRANLLFVLPFVFAWRAFTADSTGLLLGLAAFGLMILGAWLTREGLRAEAEFDARTVARKPAIPRKLFGAAMTGAGIGAGALLGGQNIFFAVAFGVVGAVLHLGAFGLDPMRDKGAEGIDQFNLDRVAKAVDEGEGYLAAMKDAILRANDRGVADRVDRFAANARALFRAVEGDPGDLTAARKYLSVYLMGARDATVKFADVYARNRDPAVKADFEALLGELETTFATRTKEFLAGTRSDLDIEIGVLRDRLKFETR
jgi:hypothetical protein